MEASQCVCCGFPLGNKNTYVWLEKTDKPKSWFALLLKILAFAVWAFGAFGSIPLARTISSFQQYFPDDTKFSVGLMIGFLIGFALIGAMIYGAATVVEDIRSIRNNIGSLILRTDERRLWIPPSAAQADGMRPAWLPQQYADGTYPGGEEADAGPQDFCGG